MIRQPPPGAEVPHFEPPTNVWRPSCQNCGQEYPDGKPYEEDGESGDICKECFDNEVKRRIGAAIIKAKIPEMYIWASLDAPELQQRVRPASALKEAKRALEAQSVVLQGREPGVGKTSFATALLCERFLRAVSIPTKRFAEWNSESARARKRREGLLGLFVSTYELAKARRETKLGAGEAELVDKAMHAGVLLLDELGAEFGKDTAVAEIIHERHAQCRPTIYTTAFGLEELKARYGGGIVRRVFEHAVVIALGGK